MKLLNTRLLYRILYLAKVRHADKLSSEISTKSAHMLKLAEDTAEIIRNTVQVDRPLRKPEEKPQYSGVNDMLARLLEGGWKWHVHPGRGGTEIENYVAYKAVSGREIAYTVYGQSLVDRRVRLQIVVSADITPEFTASFECDGKEFGSAAPEIETAGQEALLDLCCIVIAGKLDRYNHEAVKNEAIRSEAS